MGAVSLETGAYGQAQAELSEGLALAQSCGDVKVTLEGLSVLAALATRQGHPRQRRRPWLLSSTTRPLFKKCVTMPSCSWPKPKPL
ncbi:MAG: hypothetical protein M5U34_05120 [Chloroflexi bacterium]|nr:hypothetical protein [Chloroflexota bacterium]